MSGDGAGGVSGGAQQEEASYDAVLREVKEETGLDVKEDAEERIYVYIQRENRGEGDNYFVDVLSFYIRY